MAAAKAKAKAGDKAKAEDEKPGYVMPAVERGDVVQWHDEVEAAPTAIAVVTAVGTETVTLAVLGQGYQNFIIRTGVRHKAHPNPELVRATGEGAWTHRPGHLDLLERLELLESNLNALMTPPGPSQP